MTRYFSIATLVALLAFSTGASAQMPPETYQGSPGDRLKAQFVCLTQSFKDGGRVGHHLASGEYRNPTTCNIEGTPTKKPFGF